MFPAGVAQISNFNLETFRKSSLKIIKRNLMFVIVEEVLD
jgi:hypothetical protein